MELRNERLATSVAERFAPRVGAPVAHAAHAGPVACPRPWAPGVVYRGHLEGGAVVADARGRVLARRERRQGAGFAIADVEPGRVPPARELPDRFWLHRRQALPALMWNLQRLHGRRWYRRHAAGRPPSPRSIFTLSMVKSGAAPAVPEHTRARDRGGGRTMTVTKSHAEGLGSSRASLGELCDHIAAVHHERLRRELPRIAELLDSVMRVHGPVHLWLRDLPPVFRGLRAELESQLELEERTLFPACRAPDASGAGVLVDEVLLAHEEHHRRVGEALVALRGLTDDYDVARALCRTHRRLLEGLGELEHDLHEHLDEERVLFGRVREVLDAHTPTAREHAE
jgi:iron-sulfur cluster repair di-iron protein